MKLNNRGFAISGVLYSLLILFVTLFLGILTILASTKFSLDKVKIDIIGKLETLIYRDTILNGADPVLKEGMIPVTIDTNGTVKKADMTKKWYDYDNKMWANAVTVSKDNRSFYEASDPGVIIAESDILTYFVWIPRYRYRLWQAEVIDGAEAETDISKVHSINIVFESKNTAKSNGSINGQYLTHPAFTFGGDELNGLWVGKFESGYSGAATTLGAEIPTSDSTKIVIKPNVYSWRNIDINNAYNAVRGMNANENKFGLSVATNTHMMKNIEWGAVSYLAHSNYGTCSSGMCTKVYINNTSSFITGCGADSESEESTDSCKNSYGTKINGIYNQSTTGNITGIFDMNGGASEYVMGYTTGSNTEYGLSGFTSTSFPNSEYIDIYSSTNTIQYSNRILGDATGETGPFSLNEYYIGSWYNNHASFIDSNNPWFTRGGTYNQTTNAGIFNFGATTGAASSGVSFRVVVAH